jgi:hypothetical protein
MHAYDMCVVYRHESLLCTARMYVQTQMWETVCRLHSICV